MELGFILFAIFVIIITVGGFAAVVYRIIKFFKNRSLPSIGIKKSIEKKQLERERIKRERIERERIEKERIETEIIEKEQKKIDDAEAVAVKVATNKKRGVLPKGFEAKPTLPLNHPMKIPEYLKPKIANDYVKKREQKKSTIKPKPTLPLNHPMKIPEYLKPKTDEDYVKKREQLERERIEREQLERERIKRERIEREQLERERIEREQLERERIKRERIEREREHNEQTFLSTSKLLDRIKNKKEFDKDRKFAYSLFHLTHIDNLENILSNGILSHDLAMSKTPKRISNDEIVKRRSKKPISPGHTLSYYANFYFNARNPMLYQKVLELGNLSKNIIVFEIDYPLSDFEGVIYVSDGNCANNNTRIESILKSEDTDANPTQSIWGFINYILTVSSWKDKDKPEEAEKKRRIMAECLIPKKVDISFIHTIHVKNNDIEEKINRIILDKSPNFKNIKVKQNPEMFFSSWGL
jgi:hypothetical protein